MRVLTGVVFGLALWLVAPIMAYAQGTIAGVVKDTSGAVLPGVTVEAASLALIEKVRSVVTDGTGQYKVVDLRPGTYSVTFMLAGFNTFKRDGLELSGNFTATVNAELRVGTLAETITVTGEAPAVDVQSVTQQRVMGKDILDSIPAGRSHTNIAALIPGMVGGNDVGGTNNLNIGPLSVHGGRSTDSRVNIDGLPIGNAAGNGEASNFIPDLTNTQEVAVSFAAGSADQAFGGVLINLVPREGGNTFKGSVFATGANASFQGSNYTQALKDQGLKAPNSIDVLSDFNPGGGGRIVRDKLWFYSSARFQVTKTYIAGLWNNLNAGDPTKWTYAPDLANQAILPLSQKSVNTRLTLQASPRNKFGGYYETQVRKWDSLSATTSPEAPQHYDFPQNRFMTASWSSPVTSRLLLDVRASDLVQGWRDRYPQDPNDPNPVTSLQFGQPIPSVYRDLIPVTEQAGIIPGLIYRGGGNVSATQPYITVKGWIGSVQASLSYVTGAHALKVGFLDTFGERAVNYDDTTAHLRYRFNNGIPNQLTEQATPFGFVNRMGAELGIYAQDKWTLQRLTLNVGVRYDYMDLHFPEQHLGPGRLVPTRDITFPEIDYAAWKDLSPRLGAVYDLFGNGKTAVKANLGHYPLAQRMTNDYTNFGNPVNTLANLITRSWTDANGNFIPECDLFNPLANGECGPLANANFGKAISSTVSDPSILRGWNKRPADWEFEVGAQHQLLPRVGVDVGYFRRLYTNFTAIDNRLTAPSDFSPFSITAPVDPRLPSGGGYLVSGLYNLNPNKVGQVNNYFTAASNYGNQIEHWNGFDVTVNARPRTGVLLQGGADIGRTTTDNCDVIPKLGGNPSTQFCHVDTGFLTQVKLLGTYTVPKVDVQISGTLRSLPGPSITATYNAPNAIVQPSLGRPLSGGAANVAVSLIDPGATYGERSNQVDFRFSKILKASRFRAAVSLDLYNALNSSPVLAVNTTYTPTTWLTPQSILLARFMKLGVQLDF